MILYFTSTGNSKFVAEILKLDLQDTAVSLNHIFKNNKKMEFYTEAPYVIVCPIYAWRLPRKIETFLNKAHFNGSQSIYIVATMGDSYGLADQYCKKIFLKRKMDYKGFAGILMPDNYMVSNKMLSKNEAISKIQSNLPYLHEISKHILNRSELEMKISSKKNAWLLSSIANWGFNTFMRNSRSFNVDNTTCIQCQKCVRVCPTNNICMKNGRINFKNECMFCLGCIHNCPVHAIDYKGKLKANGYYLCPPLTDLLK